MDPSDTLIEARLEAGKIVLAFTDGRRISNAVCELCTVLSTSSCTELPCAMFVKPYFYQLRWHPSGRLERTLVEVDQLPTWPLDIFVPLRPHDKAPVLFSLHLFGIENLANESLTGFSVCEDLMLLLSTNKLSLRTKHSQLVISISESFSLNIQRLLADTDWPTVAREVWRLCLYSIPDPYAEPLWLNQHELFRPVMVTDTLPLLVISDQEQSHHSAYADMYVINENEIVRALYAHSAATLFDTITVHGFVTPSHLAHTSLATQSMWLQLLGFLEITNQLLTSIHTHLAKGSETEVILFPDSICEYMRSLLRDHRPYGHLALMDLYCKADRFPTKNSANSVRQALLGFVTTYLYRTGTSDDLDLFFVSSLSGDHKHFDRDSPLSVALRSDRKVPELQLTLQINSCISSVLSISFYRAQLRDFTTANLGLHLAWKYFQKHWYPGFQLWLATTCDLIQCFNAIGQENNALKILPDVLLAIENDPIFSSIVDTDPELRRSFSNLRVLNSLDAVQEQFSPNEATQATQNQNSRTTQTWHETLDFNWVVSRQTFESKLAKKNIEAFMSFQIMISDSYIGLACYSQAEQILESVFRYSNESDNQNRFLSALRLSKVMRRQSSPMDDPLYLEIIQTMTETLGNSSPNLWVFCYDEFENIVAQSSETFHQTGASIHAIMGLIRKLRQHDFEHLRGSEINLRLSELELQYFPVKEGLADDEKTIKEPTGDTFPSTSTSPPYPLWSPKPKTESQPFKKYAQDGVENSAAERPPISKNEIRSGVQRATSALFKSIELGDLRMIQHLMIEGADLSARNREGSMPLYRAAELGHEKIVRFFLSNGVDTEAKSTGSGKTALAIAAANGHENVVKLLLPKKVDSKPAFLPERAAVSPTPKNKIDIDWETSIELSGHSESVTMIFFSPSGKLLASVSYDMTIRLWDAATGQDYHVLKGHLAWINTVAFTFDETLAASGSDDKTIRIWNVAGGQLRHVLTGHLGWIETITFTPDNRLLASGSDDETVRLWNVATGQLRHVLTGHVGGINAVIFAPNGKLLASVSDDKTVRLWDVAKGQLRHVLLGHTDWIKTVAFSPAGKLIATGSGDKTIRLWDVATGQLRHILKGHLGWIETVAFSPDGMLLASGSGDNTVRVWHAAKGQLRQVLTGHTGWIGTVAFTHGSQLLASGSFDKTVRVYDLATGQLRCFLGDHADYINAVTFQPDGKLVASGSNDATVRLWSKMQT